MKFNKLTNELTNEVIHEGNTKQISTMNRHGTDTWRQKEY